MRTDGKRGFAVVLLPSILVFSIAPAARAAQVEPVSEAVKARFGLADFYKKQVLVGNFPILGSEKVSDFALLEAAYIISKMLEGRGDILDALAARKFRCTVMAWNELTTDVPEHSDLRPPAYWNRRARGLGATPQRPCISCAEENLLQYPGDPYSTENILVHEFGHTIHEALKGLEPQFDAELRKTYERAKERGLWTGTYAGRNPDEYWAEGVQSYFGTNRENDREHNHVNTREELAEYDPDLHGLLDRVFRGNPWRYVPPKAREEKAHLSGYDPSSAPTFQWPESLRAARRLDPVEKTIEGWKVLVDPRLLEGPQSSVGDLALRALGSQLLAIALLLGEDRLSKLRELEIWVELENPRLNSMQYHPSAEWLRENGHDPRLAKKVHIPHAEDLLSREENARHPWRLLHELAHAYQDRFLGWENPRLREAYENAVKSGTYESVLHISGERTRHYALSNLHEYFAEGTEAYFFQNDFYPFVRAELKEHDPALYEFLREVWGPMLPSPASRPDDPRITRLTYFGERPDWSADGKRLIFVEKTFGDVYEIEVETRVLRPLTHHYFHEGYTRALHLSNGDVLLSGAREFRASDPWPSRNSEAELWVLRRPFDQPPVALGTKCSEGPAVSRKALRIAWTVDHGDYPDEIPEGVSQIWIGDIVYAGGKPELQNRKKVLDSRDLPFHCSLETQDFRPPDERELIFSAYGYQGTEVMGVDIETGKVVNYSNAPDQYDEPEGIFPDGKHTLVECDRHSRKGAGFIDIYRLALDGSGALERLTYFNDRPPYKASNPVVSPDGKRIAFQEARTHEPAGVGHGILILELEK